MELDKLIRQLDFINEQFHKNYYIKIYSDSSSSIHEMENESHFIHNYDLNDLEFNLKQILQKNLRL